MFKIRSKVFRCGACGSEFSVSTNLRNHIEANHFTPGYHCDICNVILKTHNSLNYHNMRNHGNVCHLCELTFTTKTLLRQHLAHFHV